MTAKKLVSAAIVLAALFPPPAGRARGAEWPPPGEPVRLPVTRDTWTSTVGDEAYGNNGGSGRLKLKGLQEHTLFDVDATALKGKLITGALWHVRSASAKAPLLRVTVSTLASPFVEGTASGYKRQEGSSCFAQAELGRRDWAYPGSTLMDVAWGRGRTIWRFAEASAPDAGGWQAVAVAPDVVAARVAGLSHGFAAYDDVGSVWSYTGGKFRYTYFPNRFLHSRQSRGSSPWLQVWVRGEDLTPPPAVSGIAATIGDLPAGEALLTWRTPEDTGGGHTLGFRVHYDVGDGPKPVPRYLIPMAGKEGRTVRMHLQDLPLAAGQRIKLTVAAVDSAGNVGPGVTEEIVVSSTRPLEIAAGAEPFPPSTDLPAVGGLKVAVLDLTDKVHPATGKMVPPRPQGYKGGNHLYSAAKRLVRLHAARNEAVCFQVNLAGRARDVSVKLAFPDAAGIETTLYRLDCVATGAGPLPDVCIPLDGAVSIPPADDPEAAGAKNLSLLAEAYVPHDCPPAAKAGKLTISAGGQTVELDVALTVWQAVLPNKLSFIPEMNCYGTADPEGGIGYYRTAHEHRLCLNRLYYNWRGQPSRAPKWDGERMDFAAWDEDFAPLLDGSAFADLPRKGEPVDVFYLPFNENWPVDVYEHYRPSYWIGSAFGPEYSGELKRAFAAFAAHCEAKRWRETIFEFYLNNKVYYKRRDWRRSSAPWIFDEPVGTQDFWALRQYGLWFLQAVRPVAKTTRLWFRNDISRTDYGRNILWGVMDLECMGGANAQKARMKREERILSRRVYHQEYGSANDPAAANIQPVVWCLTAWSRGADGVLPWQTIGSAENLRKGSKTGLFIPQGGTVRASVRVKAFRRGQQDVELLTMLACVYKQPRVAVAGGLTRRVDLRGKVHKTSEADAGTVRFDAADPVALWRVRTGAGAMLSAKAPPYRRRIHPMPTPEWDPDALPDIGYVVPAPRHPPSRPEMDRR